MSKPISAEIITETWQRMARTPHDQVNRIIAQMRQEQPAILAYLIAQSEDPFDPHETELILYIGVVVWQIMRRGGKHLRRVKVKMLEQAEEANCQFLEQLSEDTEADFMSATLAMLEDYSEPEVFRYIVEAIMDEEDYEPGDRPIRDEYRGLAFMQLKTVLDALIASVKP